MSLDPLPVHSGGIVATAVPLVGWDTVEGRALLAGASTRLEELRTIMDSVPIKLHPFSVDDQWVDYLGHCLGYRTVWRKYWDYSTKKRLIAVSLVALQYKGSEYGLLTVLEAISPSIGDDIDGPRLWGDVGAAMADIAVAGDTLGSKMTLFRWLRLPLSVVRYSPLWYDIITIVEFMAPIEVEIRPTYYDALADITVAGEPTFS